VAAYLAVRKGQGWTTVDTAALVFVGVNLLSGLLDDWMKEIKQRNDGLLGYQKLLIQTIAAGLFFGLARPDPAWNIRLASGVVLLGGWAFYSISLIYAVGMVNAFNLTDGLDGLLAKASLPVLVWPLSHQCSSLGVGWNPASGSSRVCYVVSLLQWNKSICLHGRYGIAGTRFDLYCMGVCLREFSFVGASGRSVSGGGPECHDSSTRVQGVGPHQEGISDGTYSSSLRETRMGRTENR